MDEAKPFGTYAPRGFVRWAVEATRSLPDTWLGRRLTILIRRVVLAQLSGAPVDIEALGARMRVVPYRNICEKRMLFNPHVFDAQELEMLASRIQDGFVFLDVGANIGAYSLFVAARAGPSARILALEPQPHIFERLIANIRFNAFASIKAVACAVADKSGELTLFIDPRNSGESSVKIVAVGNAEPIRVPAKTLMDIARDERLARIDAIKLDVEGAEDIILGPFFAEAPEHLFPAFMIVENTIDNWQIDLPALLVSRGYRQLARTRMNLVFERSASGEPKTTTGVP